MPRLRASLSPVVRDWKEAARFVGILRRFRVQLRSQWKPMAVAVLASLAYTLVTLLEPWPLQVVFDGVFLDRPAVILGVDVIALARGNAFVLIAGASAAILIIAALRGQFYYVQNVRAATSGQDVVMAIRRQLFAHLQSLDLGFHRKARSGDLLMRMTGDIVMLREMVVAALITLLTQGLVVLGILVIMAPLNLRLTFVAVLIVPLLFIVLSVFRIRLVDAARRQRKREGRLASVVHEVLAGVQAVQANTAEKHENDRFAEMNKRSLRAGVRLTRIEAQLNRSIQISLAAGVCLTVWIGSRDVLAGELSPGQLLVFLAYLRSLYRPLRQVSKLTQRMAKASACGDRVLEVLDQVPAIQDPPGAVTLRGVKGEIVFRGVHFHYEKGSPVLEDVNLEIGPREKVAIVGPTGEGKTTLLSLIPRFLDPKKGQVLLDGVPVDTVRLRSLRRQISLLPQDAVLMGISVRENIAYGAMGTKHPDPPQSEIERVATLARARDFIEELPRGYDTVIGERGATLSGGQRQRIAIARALLRNAPVLLMDEPITGLDPLAAEAVLDSMEVLTRKRTTLIVAHNLATVLRADRIVFLSDGQIQEQGSHEDLLARGGRYAEFFQSEWGGLSRGGGP